MLGADRIRQIVLSIRDFSRLDEAAVKAVNIHEGIGSTLLLLQNKLQKESENIASTNYPKIEVIKEYSDLPLVQCYPGQLNQVFMNILNNAIDTLEESFVKWHQFTQEEQETSTLDTGKIWIKTELTDNGNIRIWIADRSLGISSDIYNKIFDPLFTTKPVGRGTGLGLSISYQIAIEKHQGQLRCFSTPNQGTEFIIEIPIVQKYQQSTSVETS